METLISEAGPHSPEVWADLTARSVTGHHDNGNAAAHDLQDAIKQTMIPIHRAVQLAERQALAINPKHVAQVVDLSDALDGALAAVLNVGLVSPWAEHFAKREVQDAIRETIGRHMATEINIERLWHAHDHPDCEYVKQFQQGHINGDH